MVDEPDIRVEIAFTDSYTESDPDWTDITEYVRGFSSSVGRTTEVDAIQTGTAQIVLDNADGRFTPGRTTSPYYPNVVPCRQVRIRDANASQSSDGGPVAYNMFTNPRFFGSWFQGIGSYTGTLATYMNSKPWYDLVRHYTTNPNLAPWDDDNLIDGILQVAGDNSGFNTPKYSVSPGDVVTANGEFICQVVGPGLPDTGQPQGMVTLRFYNSAGTLLSSSAGPVVSMTPDMEHYRNNSTLTATAPANAASVDCLVNMYSLQNADASRIGYCMCTGLAVAKWLPGTTPMPLLFTGESPAIDGYRFAWEGSPDQSRTVMYSNADDPGVIAGGFIEDWPVDFSSTSGEITVTIVDQLDPLLEEGQSLPDPVSYEILSRNPTDYYPMADDGSEKFYSVVNPSKYASVVRSIPLTNTTAYSTVTEPPTVAADGDPIVPGVRLSPVRSLNQASTANGNLMVGVKIPIDRVSLASDSFSLFALYECYGIIAGYSPAPIGLYNSSTGAFLRFGFDTSTSSRLLHVEARRSSSAETCWAAVPAWMGSTGQPTDANFAAEGPLFRGMYSLAWDASKQRLISGTGGYPYIWWNGGLWEEPSFYQPSTGNFVHAADIIAGVTFDSLYALGTTKEGFGDHAVQSIAWWHGYAFTGADTNNLSVALNGRPAETIDRRINHLLDVRGWPPERRNVDPSSLREAVTTWADDSTPGTEVQQAATDALGLFYMSPGQVATFYDGERRALKTTPDWIFEHDGGTAVEAGFSVRSTRSDIVNVANVTNGSTALATVKNDESADLYGTNPTDATLNLESSDQAIQYGYHMVNRYGKPQVRIDSVTFYPSAQADGALWDAAVNVRLNDMVRLTGLPANAPSSEMDFFVETVSHDCSLAGERLDWSVTLNLSPVDLWDAWLLADSTYGVLGSTTLLGY